MNVDGASGGGGSAKSKAMDDGGSVAKTGCADGGKGWDGGGRKGIGGG